MFFQHVYDKSLAQASYFIGCQAKGEAMVIDAQRDIECYRFLLFVVAVRFPLLSVFCFHRMARQKQELKVGIGFS